MEYKSYVWELIVAIVTAIITFLTTKRKYRAESKEIENKVTNTILETWNLEFESMKKRIEEYISQINNLNEKVKKVESENSQLRADIDKFEKKYGKQTTRKIPN